MISISRERIFVGLIGISYVLSYLTIYGIIGRNRYYIIYLIWFLYITIIAYIAKNEGFNILSWRTRYNIILFAAIIGFLQVSIYFVSGLFYGFGLSPYVHSISGYIVNTLFFIPPLMSRELFRSYIFKKSSRANVPCRFILYSIFLGLISLPLSNYRFLFSGMDKYILEFLGSQLVPNLVSSMFASYMVILGGPIASILYYLIITSITWYMPILPDLNWPVSSLINVAVSLIGFAFAENLSIVHHLRRAGLIDGSFRSRKEFIPRRFIITLILMITLIWGITGLLGVYPAVIISGSMNPALDMGDITIVKEVPPFEISVGDIIQYQAGDGTTITHRVIDINSQEGTGYFITRGDANSVPDTPVYSMQVNGKVILILPKIGWIVIYMKMFISLLYRYVSMNPMPFIYLSILIIVMGILAKRGDLERFFRRSRKILG